MYFRCLDCGSSGAFVLDEMNFKRCTRCGSALLVEDLMKIARKRFTGEQLELERLIHSIGLETILEKSFDPYVVDIYLPESNSGIEYDGPMHISKKRDQGRDEFLLGKYGVRILRVKNLRDPELVNRIKEFICEETN